MIVENEQRKRVALIRERERKSSEGVVGELRQKAKCLMAIGYYY